MVRKDNIRSFGFVNMVSLISIPLLPKIVLLALISNF
uniref:Uncharacterized protein n=1 Tax=Arundo donax TaxID=35708 RepID=A0A0A9EAH8_ARUDO